jgi:maltooligosyltrehalose trehalohydrolase
MQKDQHGYFTLELRNAKTGLLYRYRPGASAKPLPDPASAFQPEGIHGPSQLYDHRSYSWQDSSWRGLPIENLIFYEIHVGAFTEEGSFDAIIPRLDELADCGINAIELMPVAQCPGSRNWGYDGVFPYAVQNTYGGPDGLKRLVDACHDKGISVWLDVVYNHLGTEGNYLPAFGPYFSDKYHTPWGEALNFDGAWSDGVREYIVSNALYWAEHFHIDGLRLDAIHEIFDRNAVTIWDCLHNAICDWERTSGRKLGIIAESDLNNPRLVLPPQQGGNGFDAQWLDDFHHSLYVLLDKAGFKNYGDYGQLTQLAKAYSEGFVHSGEYVQFRHRSHGASSAGFPGHHFVIFNQNHDIPGNRPDGKRLAAIVDLPRLKLAAAAILLSPYIPLLFMGEEYGETAPFFFFSDYNDAEVVERQRKGRAEQFAGFGWDTLPPDGQEKDSFIRSRLQWDLRQQGQHRELLEWHKKLITLRRSHPLLRDLSKKYFRADMIGERGIALRRHSADGKDSLICLLNFSDRPLECAEIKGDLPPWGVEILDTRPF